MLKRWTLYPLCTLCLAAIFMLMSGCGAGGGGTETPSGHTSYFPTVNPDGGPAAGHPDGSAPIPAEANLEDVTDPDQVVGNGTPESCSADAFIDAVAQGEPLYSTAVPIRSP
jgi:hypothetical protein